MITKECELLKNLRLNTDRVEKRDVSKINSVKQNKIKKKLPVK